MEFKTTAGGTTTLQLEPYELQEVHAAARRQLGTAAVRADVLDHFTRVQRQHPLASFDEVLIFAFPPTGKWVARPPGPADRSDDPLLDTARILSRIQTAHAQAGSMQVEAYLLSAWATANQTQVLAGRLDALRRLLDQTP